MGPQRTTGDIRRVAGSQQLLSPGCTRAGMIIGRRESRAAIIAAVGCAVRHLQAQDSALDSASQTRNCKLIIRTELALLYFRGTLGTIVVSTVSFNSNPVNGIATVNGATGVVTYTPNAGFIGTDTFTYTVLDNDGARYDTRSWINNCSSICRAGNNQD